MVINQFLIDWHILSHREPTLQVPWRSRTPLKFWNSIIQILYRVMVVHYVYWKRLVITKILQTRGKRRVKR